MVHDVWTRRESANEGERKRENFVGRIGTRIDIIEIRVSAKERRVMENEEVFRRTSNCRTDTAKWLDRLVSGR